MFENVGKICFASCYGIALVWEVMRLRRSTTWETTFEILALGAGIFAHTAYLYYRILFFERLPLSSIQDGFLVGSWIFACLSLGMISTHRQRNFGVVLIPVTLILLILASFFPQSTTLTTQPASVVWGTVHGVSMTLASVSILCGCLSGVFYLRKAWLLKHSAVPSRGRLPSLEWLHYANRHATKFSAVMLGLGVLSGVVLTRLAALQGNQVVWWRDTMILATLGLLLWFVVSLLVGFVWKQANAGHQIAYRTILSFVALCVLVFLGISTEHRHNRTVSPPDVQHTETPGGEQ